MKKTLAIIVTSALLLGLYPLAAAAASYSDLPGSHWAYKAILEMSDSGIINGFPDGTFKPADTVTYGEFIKMAYIAQGGNEPEQNTSNWALPYYEAAAGAGLFAESHISKADIPYPIPREYMALVLSNILGEVSIEDYDGVQAKFADISWDTPREYDITKVAAYGLITGYPDGTFKPERTLSRAEAAIVIYRLVNEDEREIPEKEAGEEETPGGDAVEPFPKMENVTKAERIATADEFLKGKSLLEQFYAFKNSDSSFYAERPLVGIAEYLKSTKPISDIADDINEVDAYEFTKANILYYEIFGDFPNKMTIEDSGWTTVTAEVLEIGTRAPDGTAYLIKDRKAIGWTGGNTKLISAVLKDGATEYIYPFPDFDYIVFSPNESGVSLVLPNKL